MTKQDDVKRLVATLILTVGLAGCASHHASQASDRTDSSGSGVEFYGDIDVGVSHERLSR